jgi:alpha-1,6-mannosyltransferase
VHISDLAVQTGASLFTQTRAPPFPAPLCAPAASAEWVYDKTEGLTTRELAASTRYTHLVAEAWGDRHVLYDPARWTLLRTIRAFDGWSIDEDVVRAIREGSWASLLRLREVLRMREADKLWILERRT